LINNQGETEAVAHEACVETWTRHGVKPLFHYTEGKTKPLDRSHIDIITSLPPYIDVDMEIEAKGKNDALAHALKLQGNMVS
jgi:UV DNA damage repair endonuclease